MRHSAFTYVKMQSVIFFNVMLNVTQSNVMAPSLELKSRPFMFRKKVSYNYEGIYDKTFYSCYSKHVAVLTTLKFLCSYQRAQ
jgi:hypothetical protein